MSDQSTFRSCPDEFESSIEEIVHFDYELVTSAGKDVLGAIKGLEARILEDLAASILDCDILSLGKSNETNSNHSEGLVALDANPPDTIDSDHVDCVTQNRISNDGACTPINGFMTAAMFCSYCAIPESTIMKRIQIGMEDDLYVNDEILQVSFLGIRPQAQKKTPPEGEGSIRGDNDELVDRQDEPKPVTLLGGFLTFALCFGVTLAMFTIWRRVKIRKRVKTKSGSNSSKIAKELDNEKDGVNDITMNIDMDDTESLDDYVSDQEKIPNDFVTGVPHCTDFESSDMNISDDKILERVSVLDSSDQNCLKQWCSEDAENEEGFELSFDNDNLNWKGQK